MYAKGLSLIPISVHKPNLYTSTESSTAGESTFSLSSLTTQHFSLLPSNKPSLNKNNAILNLLPSFSTSKFPAFSTPSQLHQSHLAPCQPPTSQLSASQLSSVQLAPAPIHLGPASQFPPTQLSQSTSSICNLASSQMGSSHLGGTSMAGLAGCLMANSGISSVQMAVSQLSSLSQATLPLPSTVVTIADSNLRR